MESVDLGIDLGTASTLIYRRDKGIVLREPSVVAFNERTNRIVGVGQQALVMVGKTPSYIHAVFPLQSGVISNHKMTEAMLEYFLRKCSTAYTVKPRVSLCVPSLVTNIEAQAVASAAAWAGARSAYLVEEPVAAAIGAGLDITAPEGRLILDIGGGTSDVAVLSLGGIVCKNAVKVAGQAFDKAIVRHIINTHSLLIGESMAERIKIAIGNVGPDGQQDRTVFNAKGRSLMDGLPIQVPITAAELYPHLRGLAEVILRAVRNVLEQTPPELAGDLHENGLVMTGAGAMLKGLDKMLEEDMKIPVRVAEEPSECVAVGTGMSFQYVDQLVDGFVISNLHKH